ncbi:hypothetical protein AwDysgo_14500 [Bacteroidales bacterium]|nr:hypothetical protein AwDysgo_14500 [Bacteroidales bacterium]
MLNTACNSSNDDDYTNIRLETIAQLPSILDGISGLSYFKNGSEWQLWGHNDSYRSPNIYRINPLSGEIIQTIEIEDDGNPFWNMDWEDMTDDENHIYIANTGNNMAGDRGANVENGRSDSLVIYKIAKSKIPASTTGKIENKDVEKIYFAYKEQTPPLSRQEPNDTEYDCEAIAYANGKIHLFTKNWKHSQTTHYELPIEAGTYVIEAIETIQLESYQLVTGADYKNNRLCLIGYSTGLQTFASVFDGLEASNFKLLQAKKRSNLAIGASWRFGQIESLAIKPNGDAIFANEKLIPPETFNNSPIPPALHSLKLSGL